MFAVGDCAGFVEQTQRQVLPALAQVRYPFFYHYNMYLHRAFTSLFLFMWVLLLNSVKSKKGLTKSLACTNGLKNGMPILALSLILGSCTTTTRATTITSSVSTSCLFISENLFSYRSNGHPNSQVILCV